MDGKEIQRFNAPPAADGLVRYDVPLSVEQISQQRNLIVDVMKKFMKDGIHYGTIPGCPKPSLWKPGSELISSIFRIGVRYQVEDLSTGDNFRYRVRSEAFNQFSGNILGEATGECSSDEDKYRWKKPVCDAEFDATPEDRRRTKWMHGKSNPYSVKQIRTSPADIANTILKMAVKRSMIAVTLQVTAASDIFTQDVEDLEGSVELGQSTPPVATPQRKSAAAPASQEPPKANGPGSTLEGVVESVEQTNGVKDGKPWTRWGICIGENKYGTFSQTLANEAKDFADSRVTVILEYEQNGKYLNAISIKAKE